MIISKSVMQIVGKNSAYKALKKLSLNIHIIIIGITVRVRILLYGFGIKKELANAIGTVIARYKYFCFADVCIFKTFKKNSIVSGISISDRNIEKNIIKFSFWVVIATHSLLKISIVIYNLHKIFSVFFANETKRVWRSLKEYSVCLKIYITNVINVNNKRFVTSNKIFWETQRNFIKRPICLYYAGS